MPAIYEVLNINSSRSLTCRSFLGKGFFCPFHLHHEFELVFIEKGYVEAFIGNQKQHLSAGELQLIGANVPHSFKLDGEAHMQLLSKYIHLEDGCFTTLKYIAEFEFVVELIELFSSGAVYQLNPVMKQRYLLIFEKQGTKRLLAALDFFTELLKLTPIRYASENYLLCDNSSSAMSFIMLNATQDIRLAEVAKQLNMSVSTLTRTLKKSLGMTYVEFVNHTRINIACELLREECKSITQVAFDSGFKSSSQFNKTFKQTLKISPRKYRECYRTLQPDALINLDEPIWDTGTPC